MSPGRRHDLSRRRFIAGGAAVAAGGAAAAGIVVSGSADGGGHHGAGAPAAAPAPPPLVELGAQPAGLPVRQHAWTRTYARDADGNPVAPRHDRLLFFDVVGTASERHRRLLEAALRTLERRFRWSPSGLLFAAGWGPAYFTRALPRPAQSPVPRARALSNVELPAIDDHHLCLHLAADDERRLVEIEASLRRGVPLHGADGPLDVSAALRWRETRTGFTGAGLPAAHQAVGGIPPGRPVGRDAPLYMGFKSNLKRNQATEDGVTIGEGPFAQGTTMHVSYMRLRLDSWYRDLSDRERVARMYAPQVSPRQADRFTTDAASDPGGYEQAVRHHGVVGHAQTSARARRDGRPLLLRRDFNTTDGGQAGLHFVCLQRTIEDFVTVRTAMNASGAQLDNPSITDTVNNGINEFMFVLRRGNYVVPARRDRSFPLV